MVYKLMIKTHNKTGLKYLCVTKRSDWQKYTGSGTYWKSHLKKYGVDIKTELLYESNDYNDFIIQCLFYSDIFNVSLSDEFANQIPECGYDNDSNGFCNFEIWWKYASDLLKSEVIQKRNVSIKHNHWTTKNLNIETKNKISNKQIEHWANFTLDERREMTEIIRSKALIFFADKQTAAYSEYVKRQSDNMLNYYRTVSVETVSERNRKQRLNTSEKSKQSRIEKIRKVYESGKHDELFIKMSKERKGIGNPAAKIIVWENVEYPKLEFEKILAEKNISKEYANYVLDNNIKSDCYRKYVTTIKTYEIIKCPHCHKTSNNKPSSFKRWHFENCKYKEK